MGIQLDFGGFDPSFIGVTIRFSNERSWQFLKAFDESNVPLPVSGLPRDERFEALCITSVLSHEARHFHDFLLTPYSAHVFRHRVQLLINLLQVLPYLFEGEANCLPVPISTWCRFDKVRRTETLAWLHPRSDFKPWNPVELPQISVVLPPSPMAELEWGAALSPLIGAAIYKREQIEQLTYNPRFVGDKISLQPWQIFELSALLIQIQDLWHTYGQEETQFFIDCLQEVEGNPYALMLNVVTGMWKQAGLTFQTDLTSAIATWSLFGSYTHDGWKACPAERFARLWLHVAKNGMHWDGDYMYLFDTWSHQLGLSTVEQGLEDTRNIFHQVSESVECHMPKLTETFLGRDTELVRGVTASVARASDHMITEFRRDPTHYVSPYSYLEHANMFVNPVVRKVFEGCGIRMSIPMAELEGEGYIVQWAIHQDGEEVILSLIEPYALSKFTFLAPGDVSHLFTLIALTDFLFAETGRARGDVQRPGLTFFSDKQLIPFEAWA